MNESPARSSQATPAHQRWLRLSKLALTFLLLGAIFWEVAPNRLLPVLLAADPLVVAAAASLTLVLNLVKPLRWQLLVRSALPGFTYSQALRSLLVAATVRLFLPGKVGEYGRLLTLRQLSVAAGLGLTTLDLLVEIQVGLLLALPAAWLLGGPAVAIGAAALLATAILVGRFPHALLCGLARLARSRWLEEHAATASASMSSLGASVHAPALLITLVLAGLRLAQLYLLIVALGQAPPVLTVIAVPLVQMADAVPLTIAGVGVREWVGLRLLPPTGIAAEAAVAAVALQSVITGFFPGLTGAPLLLAGWPFRWRVAPDSRTREQVRVPF